MIGRHVAATLGIVGLLAAVGGVIADMAAGSKGVTVGLVVACAGGAALIAAVIVDAFTSGVLERDPRPGRHHRDPDE